MSSKDGLLKQLDRVSSESMSHHPQRPAEEISSSSITLTLKADGRIVDDSDHLIKELTEAQPKGTVLRNGTIDTIENCSSENILRIIDTVSVSSTESCDSAKHRLDFLSCLEAHADILGTSPGTSHKNFPTATLNLLGTPRKITSPDLHSSSESFQNSHVPQETDKTTSDTLSLPDDEDLVHPPPNQMLQPVANNVLTHVRSLSQTTSQLANLKESTKTGNLGDTSPVNILLEGSHVKKLSDTYPVNRSALNLLKDPGLDYFKKSQVSLSKTSDLETAQDVNDKCLPGHGIESDDLDEQETSTDPSHSTVGITECCSLDSEIELPYLTDSPHYPDWKLDRRESGHLYWRRDSSTLNGVDPSSRVKFRYDIEVCEFESRSSGAEDVAEDDDELFDDDEIQAQDVDKLSMSSAEALVDRKEESQSLGSTTIICIVAVVAIIATASYRWLLSLI